MLFLCFPLVAKNTKVNKSPVLEEYKLINSDQLFLSKVDEEYISELNGNVHFFYGKTEFFSDRAFIFEKQKIARLMGNVKVLNDTLTLTADSVAYYRLEQRLVLGGSVYVREHHKDKSYRTFFSQNATYWKAEKKLIAEKNVKVFDSKERLHGFCDYLQYSHQTGYGYMNIDPILYRTGDDSLQIVAQKIEYFNGFEKVVATFDVKTFTKDYRTTSDFLIYLNKEEKAVFTGQPKFYSDFGDASAVHFYLYFKNNELDRAELEDSCKVQFTENRALPKTNWVKADFVRIHFNKRDLKDFTAENNISYYYQQEEGEKQDYVHNEATGTILTATFKQDNKVNTIRMKQNVKGKYKFKNKA